METFSKLQNLKTLLIDDDEMIRNGLTIAFQNKGCSLKACENAEKGLQTLKAERFDIVICDLRLPGMDGLQFFSMAETRQPHMLKILISGYGDVEVQRASRKIGIDAFMPKPFSIKELINLLVLLLEAHPEKIAKTCGRLQVRAPKKRTPMKKEKEERTNEKRRI